MKPYGFIYITTNTINNKKYLGMCAYHRSNHTTYLGSGKVIRRAIRKYGASAFTREIIDICQTKESMIASEIEFIKNFNCVSDLSWYNLNGGGYATKGFTGKIHSDETKAKMRENHKRPMNENTTEKFKANGKNRVKYLQEYMKQNYNSHPANKPISVDGIRYDSLRKYCAITGCKYGTLCSRLRNPKFTNVIRLLE